MFLIKRDGHPVTLIRETDERSAGAGLLRWFHKSHGYSMDHAIRHEGYSVEEVQGFVDLPFTGDPHLMTCSRHPDLRWAAKGPGRKIHYLGKITADGTYEYQNECPCALSYLYRIED